MNNAKQLVTGYMNDVWVNRKLDKVDEYIADNLIQHNPNLPNGKEALKGFLSILFTQLMPQVVWKIVRVIAEDNQVVVHSHAISVPNTPGMAVVDIFRVENGKIIEHWDVSHDIPEKTASGNSVV